jgi:mono/diheme cytochrome c family protein
MGGGGGGGDAAPAAATPAPSGESSPVPATTAAAAPAVVDSTPAVPDPVAPWVEAATTRQKIPYWALPVLALLPIWAAVYMLTLDTPTPTELGPYEAGAEVYGTNCATCHGATGGGAGANPALTGPEGATVVFEHPANQVAWVALGSAGYKAAGFPNYGDGELVKPVNSGMPAWADSLTPVELMEVVLHERSTLNDEEFDIEKWADGFEEILVEHKVPEDKIAGYMTVLEEWEAEPPEPAA